MAILGAPNQYALKGKGPLDAKSLVKTYAELLDTNTWLVEGVNSAYNGMITAVWMNNTDTSKNGVYFLFDSKITTARGTPDVTDESNWHKLGGIESLPGLADQISSIRSELEKVQTEVKVLQSSATVIVKQKAELPSEGLPGKLYVVTEEAMTFVWFNGDYLPVGDGTGDTPDIQIIHGGNAKTN